MDKKKIAIFDFDGTLYKGESMPKVWALYGKFGYSKWRKAKSAVKITFLKLLRRMKCVKKVTVEVYKDKATNYILELFKGFSKEDLDKFFDQVTPDIVKGLNPYVMKRLRELKEKGYTTIIISGGFEAYLASLNKEIGADLTIGTPLFFDKHNILDLNRPLNHVKKDGKSKRLLDLIPLEQIDVENSISFGDSIVDLDILQLVKHKEIIDPDSELEQVALQQKWKIVWSEDK